jgi:hypothetical protein
LKHLDLCSQGLLVPAIAVEAGRGRGRAHWGNGSWNTPLTGPLARWPSDEGMWRLGRSSSRWARWAARPRPHMYSPGPRVLIARPETASP